MRSRSSSLINLINNDCVTKYPLIETKINLRLAGSLKLTTCLVMLLASFISLPKKKFISSKKFGTSNLVLAKLAKGNANTFKTNKHLNKVTLADIEYKYLLQRITNYYLLLAYDFLGYFEIEDIRLTSSLRPKVKTQCFCLVASHWNEVSSKIEDIAAKSVVVRPPSYTIKDRPTALLRAEGSIHIHSFTPAFGAKQEGEIKLGYLNQVRSENVARSYIASYASSYFQSRNNLLISFSAGQDSVTLLILLFGIQSQNLLKLNLLWNHHLWHKDSFFITRHVLKLSFLFKTSSHSAIAIVPVKTELQARQWRLKVSRRLSNFYKYQNVMQAHSGTDKIETLLLNLFRGTGNISPFYSSDFSFNFSQAQKRKLFF